MLVLHRKAASGAVGRDRRAALAGMPVSWPAPAVADVEDIESDGLDLAIELAHDVRSPLGAIIALSDLLQTGACGPLTPTQTYQLRLVHDAAKAVSRLTNDVVDFGRLGALEAREPIVSFQVADVLQAVHDAVQPMVEVSGLRLLVRNYAPIEWLGRRAAITRVLLNLTINSLKYTDCGVVEFGARLLPQDRLTFFVRDTGSGFHARSLRLSDAKPAAPPSARRFASTTSTGLGLAICRRLLRSMESALAISSRPGEGSNFSFALDLRASAEDSTLTRHQ